VLLYTEVTSNTTCGNLGKRRLFWCTGLYHIVKAINQLPRPHCCFLPPP